MQKQTVIEVSHISKHFRVYYDRSYRLKDRLLFWKQNRYETREILKDISFSVSEGEAVALIGHNGCGKSTMLKLLTKIMYPDTGAISIKGRVSSLIELGAGFHPDMSGRENIYINASIFGLTHKEIDQRLQNIIAFSELEEYIDNPVRTYSSGMYMRLAFSIAINVDANVLLVDEILAVGDANFQAKCFKKLNELKAAGTTIVIVTHDTSVAASFCDRVIWINDSIIQSIGESGKVVNDYLKYMSDVQYQNAVHDDSAALSADPAPDTGAADDGNHYGSGDVVITAAYWVNERGERIRTLLASEPASIVIEYSVRGELKNSLVFGIGIYTMDYSCLYGVNTVLDSVSFEPQTKTGKAVCRFDKIRLTSAQYLLQLAIEDGNSAPLDYYNRYCDFEVISDARSIGVINMDHNWEFKEHKPA